MPSPESPAKRMTTSSRFSGSSDLVSGVAVTRPSPRCVGSCVGGIRWRLRSYRRAPSGSGMEAPAERAPYHDVIRAVPVPRARRRRAASTRRRSRARPMERGLDVDPGADAAGALVEAPAQPAHDDDLLARLERVDPGGRVPDRDRDRGGALVGGWRPPGSGRPGWRAGCPTRGPGPRARSSTGRRARPGSPGGRRWLCVGGVRWTWLPLGSDPGSGSRVGEAAASVRRGYDREGSGTGLYASAPCGTVIGRSSEVRRPGSAATT